MAKKITVKGTVKVVPSSKGKKPIKPKFNGVKGGLLTEKIAMTVRREKEAQANKSNSNE